MYGSVYLWIKWFVCIQIWFEVLNHAIFCWYKKVYSGFTNGNLQKGLELKSLDTLMVESENLNNLMPINKITSIENEIDKNNDEDDKNKKKQCWFF